MRACRNLGPACARACDPTFKRCTHTSLWRAISRSKLQAFVSFSVSIFNQFTHTLPLQLTLSPLSRLFTLGLIRASRSLPSLTGWTKRSTHTRTCAHGEKHTYREAHIYQRLDQCVCSSPLHARACECCIWTIARSRCPGVSFTRNRSWASMTPRPRTITRLRARTFSHECTQRRLAHTRSPDPGRR